MPVNVDHARSINGTASSELQKLFLFPSRGEVDVTNVTSDVQGTIVGTEGS